jgi:arylsulfate sulfotransferase
MHNCTLPLLLTLLLSIGCAEPVQFTEPPALANNPNSRAPLAGIVRFTTDRPVSTTLSVTDGTHSWSLQYDSSHDTKKGLPVVGMRASREHTVRISLKDANGVETQAPEALTITTPALPTDGDEFPNLVVSKNISDKVTHGYTLLNPRRMMPRNTSRQAGGQENQTTTDFGRNFGLITIVDDAGEVVWYYRSERRMADLQYLDNGHLLFTTTDDAIVEIDLLGNIIAEWWAANRPAGPGTGTPVDALTLHHDLDKMPNGNIIALNTERKQIDNWWSNDLDPETPRSTQWVMGDIIVEFDQTGKIVWSWNAFDYLDPMRIGYETFVNYWIRRGFPATRDWSHANGLEYLPEDDALLVNFRVQSCVVKIDRKSGDILWIFGEPTGWPDRLQDKLITMKNGSWPWHQHAPLITDRGTLLLFDNGNFQRRPFDEALPIAETHSRIVEYRIDETTLTAEEIWTSDTSGDVPVVSFAMGSVQQLAGTGNIMAGYGMTLPTDKLDQLTWNTVNRFGAWTMVREFTHTSPAEVVWELTVQPKPGSAIGWTLFGAQKFSEF